MAQPTGITFQRRVATAVYLALALTLALAVAACGSGADRSAAVRAGSAAEVTLLDFAEPMALAPLPPRWAHRTVRARPRMQMSFGSKEGVAAIRLATRASACVPIRVAWFADVRMSRSP